MPMTRVIATAIDAGRPCPYCRFPLKEGAAVERCDSCNSLHHEDCWRDGGGCAVLGCVEAGSAANTPAAWPGAAQPTAAPISSQTPPTQVYTGYGGPPGYSAVPSASGHQPAPPPIAGYPPVPPGYVPAPPAPAKPPRTGQPVLIVALLIALLGIGIGVLVATGVFSDGASTVRPSAPAAAAANEKPQAVTTTPAGPSLSEQSSDRATIMSLLDRYQSSYSDHDLSGLSSIFAPEVRRHGLAAGGCTVSHGRGAVLSDYQSQFEQGSGSYELVGLSASAIQLDSKTRAHLDAHYQITPGGAGYVNFRFAELGEGWKVSEVYATCE
jgi:hypothetical protein